ncbi:phytanoyl-CoA dioxygenase family protein [Nocardia brasiliensis]
MSAVERLGTQQVDAFHEQGFVALPALFGGSDLGRLRRVVDRLTALAGHFRASTGDFVLEAPIGGWLAWQRGKPAFAGLLRSISNAHHYEPELERILTETELARVVVSPAVDRRDPHFLTAYYWAKPPVVGSAKPWHQDIAYAPPDFRENYRNVASIWVALDEATVDNGCLEFVYGSHRWGRMKHHGTAERNDDAPRDQDATEYQVNVKSLASSRIEPVPLLPGAAVMFDGFTIHRSAANKSDSPRRALSFVFGYR